jgi:hypothetical protein
MTTDFLGLAEESTYSGKDLTSYFNRKSGGYL